jgi:hypothetical protein
MTHIDRRRATVRQAVTTAPGQIEFRDIPVPEPGPAQVLIPDCKKAYEYIDAHPERAMKVMIVLEKKGRDAVRQRVLWRFSHRVLSFPEPRSR